MTEEFLNIIISAESRLKLIGEENSSRKPSANKWSSKEILGHLVDSSINNIARFINGQFRDDFVFSGYDQNKWVTAQNYQNEKWELIIDLWKLNNMQVIHIIETIPNNLLTRTVYKHNFDLIAWEEVPKEEPVSLEYLVRDYFNHMKHHLNQIFKMHSIEQIN